jgi:fructose-specific phosphotransferase system component IIB
LGHEIKVETQGAMGIENELTDKDIASADAAILAVDIMIEKEERFDNIPKIRTSVQEAIKNPEAIFSRQAKK